MHGTAPVAHKEVEVKLELAPGSLPALNKIPQLRTAQITPKRATEVSVYFDTDKHKLRNHGYSRSESNALPRGTKITRIRF